MPISKPWVVNVRLWALSALVIFLPISAWVVSASGNYLISLGRDLLLIVILCLSLLKVNSWRRPDAITALGGLFIVLTLISFLYREDQLSQWLRGVRYFTEPFLLIGLFQLLPIENDQRNWLWKALLAGYLLVLLGAIVDFFHPEWLRLTLDKTARGYLGDYHKAGNLSRLQSLLAGPNALGLYLSSLLLMLPLWAKNIKGWSIWVLMALGLTALILTFSRSSYIGLVSGLIFVVVFGFTRLSSKQYKLAAGAMIVLLLVGIVSVVAKPEYLTRFRSNELRLEQYQRVWNERHDIGFWGRGAGAAGLVSEYRLDDGPSFFTENTYLDIYENVGVLPAIFFVAIITYLIVLLLKRKTAVALSVAAACFGLLVAGLFIDNFTGQAALWSVMAMSVVIANSPEESVI